MKILLAIDGSPCSEAAVREVASRPWPAESEVVIVTAINAPLVPDPFLIGVMVYEEMMERQRKEAPGMLEKAAEQIRGHGSALRVSTKVLHGAAKEKIVEEAEQWGADLIVLGSHGYGAISRFVLGSVSHAVAMHSPCSVEIVRCREAASPAQSPPAQKEG
jgi:nucleotide-binding universal stress UspA family protein